MCWVYSYVIGIACGNVACSQLGGIFPLCYLGKGSFFFSLAHRCDPLSPWAAGLERCMPVPAVPAPPFSEPAAPGCGVSSTTTPILAVLPSPPLSHQTRACELQHGLSWRNPLPPPLPPPRTFGTINRRAQWIATNGIKILSSRFTHSSLNVAPAGWCLFALFDIVICLANFLWELFSGQRHRVWAVLCSNTVDTGLVRYGTNEISYRRYFPAMTHGLSLTFANSVIQIGSCFEETLLRRDLNVAAST